MGVPAGFLNLGIYPPLNHGAMHLIQQVCCTFLRYDTPNKASAMHLSSFSIVRRTYLILFFVGTNDSLDK